MICLLIHTTSTALAKRRFRRLAPESVYVRSSSVAESFVSEPSQKLWKPVSQATNVVYRSTNWLLKGSFGNADGGK